MLKVDGGVVVDYCAVGIGVLTFIVLTLAAIAANG
jgi:hypothetical protein